MYFIGRTSCEEPFLTVDKSGVTEFQLSLWAQCELQTRFVGLLINASTEAFCFLALKGKFRLQQKYLGFNPDTQEISENERYSSFCWFCRHWWETTYQKKCEQGKNAQFQMVSLINGLLILIYSVIIRKSTLDFHKRIDLNMEGILVELLLPPQISSTHTHTFHFLI